MDSFYSFFWKVLYISLVLMCSNMAVSAEISLKWDVVDYAEKYKLMRDAGSGFEEVYLDTATSFSDADVVEGESYTYKVIGCLEEPTSGETLCEDVAEFSDEYSVTIDDTKVILGTLTTAIANPLSGTDEGTTVGSIPAEFSVGASGSASYTIPIAVAPGTAGLTPDMSLVYDSAQRNGQVGVGWTIGGVSLISRCPKNIEQEGEYGTIRLDEDDRLCMDGKKLFAKSGDYWALNSTYRTEDSAPIGIEITDTYNDQVSEITVTYKDGSTFVYGDSNDPIMADDTYIVAWPLASKSDASGNTIDYVYLQESGYTNFYLDYVTYRNDGQNTLYFDYEDRDDVITGYSAGYAFKIDQRLSGVRSRVNEADDELRTYTLDYDYAAVTNRSLLKSVTACSGTSCLPASTFGWQEGDLNYYEKITYAGDFPASGEDFHNTRLGGPKPYLALDMDGNGVTDYWKVRDHKDDSTDALLMIRGGARYDVIFRDGNLANKTFRYSAEVMDYNYDGRDDVIFSKDGTWQLYMSALDESDPDEINYNFDSPIDTLIPVDNNDITVADYNGDGFPDFSYVHENSLYVRLNERVVADTLASALFSDAIEINIPKLTSVSTELIDLFYDNINSLLQSVDLDGDGAAEFVLGIPAGGYDDASLLGITNVYYGDWFSFRWSAEGLEEIDNLGSFDTSEYWRQKTKTYISPESQMLDLQFTDLNSDGLPDMVYFRVSNKTTRQLYVRLNTGAGFEDEVYASDFGNQLTEGSSEYFKVADFNSDGYADLLVEIEGENLWYVSYFDGESFSTPVATQVELDVDVIHAFTDIDGNGIVDYINHTGRMHYQRASGKARDLLTGITDGSSIKTVVQYQSITDDNNTTVYERTTDAPDKNWGNGSLVVDVANPINVVSKVIRPDSTLSYQYKGLKAQIGRGLLGFEQVTNFESVKDIKRVAKYHQEFPYTGFLQSTDTYRRVTTVTTGSESLYDENTGEYYDEPTTEYNYDYYILESTDLEYDRYNGDGYVYPSVRNSTNYALDDDTNVLSQTVVQNNSPDAYSNFAEVVTTVYSDAGTTEVASTTEDNDYTLCDTHYGCRLTRQESTFTRSGESDVTQVVNYTYDTQGLLETKEVDKSGDTGYSVNDDASHGYNLKESYTRDGFGNVRWQVVTGDDIATRTTQYEYDADGRYVETETQYKNYVYDELAEEASYAVALPTLRTYDPILGALTGETSPNGQSSVLGYSQLGRLNFEWSANGSYSTVEQAWCESGCPTDAYYQKVTTVSDGPDTVEYFDVYNRKIAEKSQTLKTFDGTSGTVAWVWKHYRYDDSGRVTAQSVPHFDTKLAIIETQGSGIGTLAGYDYMEYDLLDRVTNVTRANGGEWTTAYTGLTKTTTNPDDYSKIETTNALGELVSVEDANTEVISYEYDALGNVRAISRDEGDIVTVIKHDHHGRKVQLDDPDKGIIDYQHDVLGQAIWQKDNKDQITRQSYDAFGRITSKVQRYADDTGTETGTVDQQLTYVYDTDPYGLGLVSSVTDDVNNIITTTRYNVLSLPVRTSTTIDDQTYRQYTMYDDANEFRVSATYDASGSDAGVIYQYYGDYLVMKTDTVSNHDIWQFKASDAWGNTTSYELGNGITTTMVHDDYDGTLESITSDVQLLTYQFDVLGNLEYRINDNKDMREDFEYDALNRLDYTTLSVGATNANFDVNYDNFGNIRFKTGVGTYHYDNGRPHAVSSITNGALAGSFQYDANGNMTSGGGRSNITYNTMDKPTSIQTANKTISYQYGMGGSRFKRIDAENNVEKVTLYVGNTEFIREAGVLKEVQRQIEGIALETYYPVANQRDLQYLHYDHLGSVDVITDANGLIDNEFSYDAWGQRRDPMSFLTGSLASVNQAISFQMDNFKRGFTGHEHIDDAGLIHMNGRVYDARLARFMSADPIVSAGDNLQAYNRYSYVWNNPLNATDPSGYEAASIIAAIAAVIGVEAAYVAYVAYQIYTVYSIVQGVYGAIQAFKYDQGLSGVIALAQAAYSAYNLYQSGVMNKAEFKAAVNSGNGAANADGVNGIAASNQAVADANINSGLSGGKYVPEAVSIGHNRGGAPLDNLYSIGADRMVAFCGKICMGYVNFEMFLQTVIPLYGISANMAQGNYVDAALSAVPGGRAAKGVVKGADSPLSRKAAFREAKEKAGIPRSQQPSNTYHERIRDQKGHVEGRVYEFKNADGSTATIREHTLGHKLGNHGSHFNSELRNSQGIKQPLLNNADQHTYIKQD